MNNTTKGGLQMYPSIRTAPFLNTLEKIQYPRFGPFSDVENKHNDHYHFTQVIVDNRALPQTRDERKRVPIYMKQGSRQIVDEANKVTTT